MSAAVEKKLLHPRWRPALRRCRARCWLGAHHPITHVADAEEYAAHPRDNPPEEVDEFIASGNDPSNSPASSRCYVPSPEAGTSRQQLEELRAATEMKRGSFSGRVIWSGSRRSAIQPRT